MLAAWGRTAMTYAAKLLLAALAFGVFIAGTAEAGPRLASIRAKGVLTCGILPAVAGFAAADGKGGFQGLDVDTCHAVAAAIFGNPDKIKFVIAENVRQLKDSDAIDIVARRITWSLTRATTNGLMFGPITFYDGQGFMVPKKSGVSSAKELNGKAVCVQAVEAHATSVAEYFKASGLTLTAIPVTDNAQAERALKSGACAAFSADVTWLGAARAGMAGGADSYDILPEVISKEPLAPLVRQGDDQFFEIVRWSIFAMIAAEERGINSQNVDSAAVGHPDMETQQFLGVVPGNGAALGLDEKWAYNIIKTVGNYAEVFDRNVGRDSPIKLERGLNKLWTDGGLMYAPRLR
jgi:general L-amino acid transport system substrate-binding protein